MLLQAALETTPGDSTPLGKRALEQLRENSIDRNFLFALRVIPCIEEKYRSRATVTNIDLNFVSSPNICYHRMFNNVYILLGIQAKSREMKL